jgi:energy-converting hydrogenase Eha subunit E
MEENRLKKDDLRLNLIEDPEDLVAQLEKMGKPEVSLPQHKVRLHQSLKSKLYENPPEKRKLGFVFKKIGGVVSMPLVKNMKVIAPALTIAVVILAYSFLFAGSQAATAFVTLEVNPAVQLAVDNNKEVIKVEALNQDAEKKIAGLELMGTQLTEALRIITKTTIELGYVKPENKFVLSFRAAEGAANDEFLNSLTEAAVKAVNDSLAGANKTNEVKSVILSMELFAYALKEGLLPSAYIDLIDAKLSPEAIHEILQLSKTEGVDKVVFLEELSTIAAVFKDMLEAGFDEKQAFALLQGALAADKNIEEFSAIGAAMIDLKDAGANPEKILAFIKAAIEQGIDQKILLEEISTLTEAHIDMLEAGISEEAAAAIIKEAMKVDPSLEEITTITAALIDLMEEGLTEQEALVKLRDAIKADQSLKHLDELLEDEKAEEKKSENEAAESGIPAKKPNINAPEEKKSESENKAVESDETADDHGEQSNETTAE